MPQGATCVAGGSYTFAYDAAGNMTCRAPTSSTTCAGTPTGAQLTYDNEGRMSGWQNAPSNPSSTTSDLYDGEGNRVAQFVANGSTTTTVTYVSNIEEVSTTSGVTCTTTSYYAAGQRIAQAVNGVVSELGSDGLGSAEVALDSSGNMQASALYDPYGNARYSSGTMPGSYGYTGQQADAATGLDYYNARYYDPVAGQFTSADSVQDGLNRYAYVAGNPETATDPTGHRYDCGDSCDDPGSGSGSGTGSGNGDPTSCRDDPYQSGCEDWLSWRDQSLDARARYLFGLEIAGYGTAIGGGVIEILAMYMLFRSSNEATVKDHAVARMLEAFITIVIPLLGRAASAFGWAWATAVVDGLTAFYDAARSLLNGLNALILAGGWLANYGIGIALTGLSDLAGGIPGMLGDLLEKFLADAAESFLARAKDAAEEAVADGIFAIGQGLQATGLGMLTVADAQGALNIWDWCGLNKGACGKEPNGGMPE